MAEKNLSSTDIYNQEFKIKMRGYDAVEVDTFLDLVMQDYEQFDKELAQLRQEIMQLRQRLDSGQSTQSTTAAPLNDIPTGTTNYDILRRISNLEKHVFGAKLDIN